jgi:CBS domain containing-hemolysin-like protein
MYKKRGRHDEDVKLVDKDENQFVHRVFNFMRKHLKYVMQMLVPQFSLDIGTILTMSSASR